MKFDACLEKVVTPLPDWRIESISNGNAYFDLKERYCLDALGASEEQFRQMEKNPFVLKSLKIFIKLL